MNRRVSILIVGFVAILSTGCQTVLKIPPYAPQRLGGVSRIVASVEIEVWEVLSKHGSTRMDEWSAQARENVIASVAKSFSAEGEVTVNDTRPPVPWHPGTYAMVKPHFTVPDCGLAGDRASAEAHLLEVTAIQTVKGAGLQAAAAAAGLLDPAAWLIAPFAPTVWAGYFYGGGVTAVRFCFSQPGSSVPAWAYAEWFHGGLDLRDPANTQQLVERAHQHYRAALAKRGGTR
jgi:hypothetical protein